MKINKTQEKIIGWLSVIIIFSLIYFTQRYEGKSYKEIVLKKSALTIGLVKSVNNIPRQGYVISYQFEAGNQVLSSTVNHGNIGNAEAYLVAKSFPVIYSTIDPNYNMLLFRPDDFKEFNIPFPDSLTWILKYIDKQ